jgi:hypothetical protein
MTPQSKRERATNLRAVAANRSGELAAEIIALARQLEDEADRQEAIERRIRNA